MSEPQFKRRIVADDTDSDGNCIVADKKYVRQLVGGLYEYEELEPDAMTGGILVADGLERLTHDIGYIDREDLVPLGVTLESESGVRSSYGARTPRTRFGLYFQVIKQEQFGRFKTFYKKQFGPVIPFIFQDVDENTTETRWMNDFSGLRLPGGNYRMVIELESEALS